MLEVLKKYQKQLGLLDWEISLNELDSFIEGDAGTKMIYNDHKAIVLVESKLCDVEKEKSIIHELIHLIFRDAYDIFSDQCNDEFAKKYCERQHERAVEKTAKIIYSLNHMGETS
jgi:Zn-dependent peptidase ImmA (M78 family)